MEWTCDNLYHGYLVLGHTSVFWTLGPLAFHPSCKQENLFKTACDGFGIYGTNWNSQKGGHLRIGEVLLFRFVHRVTAWARAKFTQRVFYLSLQSHRLALLFNDLEKNQSKEVTAKCGNDLLCWGTRTSLGRELETLCFQSVFSYRYFRSKIMLMRANGATYLKAGSFFLSLSEIS